MPEPGPDAVATSPVKATTDEDGGGDVVSYGRGAIGTEGGGDGWHVVDKNGRVKASGGGGVEEQAVTSFFVDEVRTC